MKKKFLAFLIMLIPMATMASVEVDGIYYELSDTEATLIAKPGAYAYYSGSITIPSSVRYGTTYYRVTAIDNGAFLDCTGLTSVTIPNSVTSIGNYAFYGCDNLTSMTIPNSVESIGNQLFYNCTRLNYIAIPNSVTSIGMDAFYNCSSLTSIIIPSSVGSIGQRAFYGCTSLATMYVNLVNPIFVSNIFPLRTNATLYVPYGSKVAYEAADYWKDFKSIEETIVFDDAKVKEICIVNWDTDHDGNLSKEEAAAVTDLGNSFMSNSNITSFNELQYFTGLKGITEQAFNHCTNLSSIIIPSNITYFDDYAFRQCNRLTSINIPSNVTLIGEYAFSECSGLSSIPLPDGLLIIRGGAFAGCSNLNSINIPSSVWDLGAGAFSGCQNLSSITIPSKVIFIQSSTFGGCSSLTTVTILSNLSAIGDEAFWGCSNLTSITIPSSVTDIGDCAFYGCTNLTSVYVNVRTPLYADNEENDIFPLRSNTTLYVPYGCKATYESADYWQDFKEILEMAPTEVNVNIGTVGVATYCSEFDLDFTETDVKAYIVSAFTPRTGKVILTRVYDVPARTGIVVMGDAGEHQIPVVEAQTVMSNMLVGVTEATELNKVDGDYTNYVFAQKNGELGFYAVTDGSTLGAHKAYLPLPTAKLPSADSRVAYMFDGDDATEIQNIGQEDNVQHSIYNLNGQRQKGLKKGLNIVDGKKMLIK